ncbi:energy transducer TonB [Flavisericum labens]|uniref:energy transducer TonB n=1 Tax=Flavisericum labens TaxID=3377112 RepID=UPI00387AC12F
MKAKKNPQLEIGRNSSTYFAIGLSLMLLFSWQVLEYKTYEKSEVTIDVVNMEGEEDEKDIPIININTPPPPPPPPAVIQENIQIVEDTEDIEETIIESTETNQEDAIVERNIVDVGDVHVEDYEEEVQVAFAIIEQVPIFPGCEGKSKAATKACFEKKIQEHVIKNFNYPQTAIDLSIQGRVSVIFIIDSKGHTTNVRSRGPDKILETEAERIIGSLPKMKPGMQRGRPVKVSYAVPIYFKLAGI